MKRCYKCKGETLAETKVEERIEVAGKTFTASVLAIKCAACGELYYPGPVLESFGFMRRALGLKAVELAELLDVTHETVSRWEHGHQPVERRAVALLSAMVLDRLEGQTTTLDRLKTLLKPKPLPKLVRLVPRIA
jgi:DNA-binding XRE family transcriptional regulator